MDKTSAPIMPPNLQINWQEKKRSVEILRKEMSSKGNVLQEFQFHDLRDIETTASPSFVDFLDKTIALAEAPRNRKKVDIDGFNVIEAGKASIWQKEEEEKPDQFKSKYDLRKSLAWDNAFFTSPGVLDPEELFETLNFHDGDNGVCNSEPKEVNALPSSESLATSRIGDCIARRSLAWDSAFFTSEGVLDQEELSMVNKGYKKSDIQTNVLPGIEEEFWKSADSNSTIDSDYSLASIEFDLFDDMRASTQNYCKASDMVNSSSKFQSPTGLPKPHSSKRLDTTSKFQMKHLPASRRQTISMDGVAKIAEETTHHPRTQHATRRGDLNTFSVKPSKAISGANPLPTATTKRASLGANYLKMENKLRKAASGECISKRPCYGDSTSIISSPTPSPELVASSRLNIGSRNFARSGCSLSTSIGKSPNLLRKRNDLPACDSSSRTPPGSLTRGRNEMLDSTQSSHLPSTPNSSCSSGSIDCWSSDTSTSRNHASDISSNSENRSCDQSFDRNQSKKTRLAYQDVDKVTKGGTSIPRAVSREIKPSGLRMPSPKIGYFDVENCQSLTPNGGLKFHSGIQSSSKTGSGVHHPNGASNKSRYGKLQSPRTSTRIANMKDKKLGSRQSENLICKAIKPKLEGGKVCEEFTFCGTVTSSVAPSFMGETDSYFESDVLGSCSNEVNGSDSQGHENQIGQKSCLNQNEDASGQALENQLRSDDKENIFSFENQVDVLSKQLECTDFKGDLVIEF